MVQNLAEISKPHIQSVLDRRKTPYPPESMKLTGSFCISSYSAMTLTMIWDFGNVERKGITSGSCSPNLIILTIVQFFPPRITFPQKTRSASGVKLSLAASYIFRAFPQSEVTLVCEDEGSASLWS